MDEINEAVLDKMTKVCLCRAIPRSVIKKAIAEGALTPEAVKLKTGAGTGGCGGARCGPKIAELILKEKTKPV